VTVQQLWNRILAVALAGVPLCAMIWMCAAWLYEAHEMLSAEIAQTQLRLRGYDTLIQHRLETQAAVDRSVRNGRNYYWLGSTEDVAAVEMQRRVLSSIAAAGGKILRVRILPAMRTGAHPAVNLRVTLEASDTALLETLYSLERDRPYLFLDQLYVRALDRSARTAQAAESVLQASMDVRGYFDPNAKAAQSQQ
jgi:hypothetical protein